MRSNHAFERAVQALALARGRQVSSVAAPTPWTLALRAAQAPVTETLRPLGFRKGGNYYNRQAEDGLVQVVGFQSGQAVSTLHGNFTVNLGVFVPCIAQLEANSPRGRYVTDAHCEVRSRLSDIAKLGKDKWWPLDDSSSKSGAVVASALRSHGIPFLERYASYEAILERFDEDGALPFHNAARSTLAAAIIHWDRGSSSQAREYFGRAQNAPAHNSRFAEYVVDLQARCGLG